jgi:hypothetical protein
MNEWIDEVCTELGIGDDVDEDLLLDVARVVAHDVERRAAPVTTYLLGLAVGRGPETLAELAPKVAALARSKSS